MWQLLEALWYSRATRPPSTLFAPAAVRDPGRDALLNELYVQLGQERDDSLDVQTIAQLSASELTLPLLLGHPILEDLEQVKVYLKKDY